MKSAERQRRYRRGLRAETLAAWYLRGKLYRILDSRFSCSAGEIDLVARRLNRLAFVEVKRRATLEAARDAVTYDNQDRVIEASHIWLSRHASLRHLSVTYDIIAIVPGTWPRHWIDAFEYA